MKNKRFIAYFLMVAGMIMLVAPLIPHHHHSSGAICMKDDVKDTECPCHHHNHHHNDDPCCTNDCLAHFETPPPTLHPDEALLQSIYSITLFIEPLFRFITQHEEIPAHRDYVYIESLYGTFITCAAGLRAPPLSFFI